MVKSHPDPLAEQDGLFRAFGDSISQMAWVAERDGYIYWYNQRWYEYTGTTPEEMEGWGWQSVHDPKFLPVVLESWRSAIQTGKAFEMEFPIRGADGVFRVFLTRARPLLDRDGKVLQWFGTNTDVNEHIEREALLRQARDAAEEASRAKDLFLAMLSHELRTPLTPILLLAGEMRNDESLPLTAQEDFAMIHRNVTLQMRMIDDLLDFTRIRQGKMQLRKEAVDLLTTLEDTLTLLNEEIVQKKLVVGRKLQPPAVPMMGDPVRLQQVFWNILRNAVKFTPENGKITIESANNDHLYRMTFTDSGMGIPSEELPHIFSAFAQGQEGSSPRLGGLGLGLAICAMVVQEHGGRIWAESAGLGHGATIHVEIPLANLKD